MLNIVATCWNVVATCWTLVQLLFSNNYTFWRELEMADEDMLLSLCASSVIAVDIKRRQKKDKQTKTITWISKDLPTRCSKFCCSLYQSCVSHVTVFVILRSYIAQARKSLVRIDQLTGVIKTDSIRTQLIPTFRPPCWYFHEGTWHQTRKRLCYCWVACEGIFRFAHT